MAVSSKMTVGTKLRLLMIFLVITLVSISAILFWSSKKFVDQINDLGEVQLPGISNMILTDMMHDGIRANVYSAILAAKDKNAEEAKAIKEESVEFATNIKNYIAELQKTNLHPETKKAIEPALPKIEAYVQSASEMVDAALSGDEEKARSMRPKFNESFEELEKELGVLGELIEKDAAESTAKGRVIERNALYLNFASFGIGVVLLIFFALVLRDQQNQLKTIIDHLNNESNRIRGTSNTLGQSAQNLSTSTGQQSRALQESATALEEISAMGNLIEDNSKKLDSNAKVSYESAANGKETIEEMLKAMNIINESNSMMMKQIEEGNKRIGDIVTVISEIENKTKVINDIVFQTKLLSFNASVEAARAGEQGKGFAVVAEEVGNLAEMSGNASKEISDMLTNSSRTVSNIVNENKTKVESLAMDGRAKVEQGIEIANRCGTVLEQIVHQASGMSNLISEINSSIGEQSKGISEVSNRMGLLDQVSNENLVTSKDNLASSSELQEQVRQLEMAIESLMTMMTSKNA